MSFEAEWPTPIELMDLKEAVDKGKERVFLSGQEFEIFYEDKSFHVSPVKGFVPCGWFDRDHAFDELLGKGRYGR